MKKLILFFLLLLQSVAFSQTYLIDYNAKFDLGGKLSQPIEQKLELQISGPNSISKKYLITGLNSNAIKTSGNKIVKIGSDTLKYFKNFNENKLYSEEKIYNKVFNVKDDLNIFEWEITSDTITILNHICYKATTTFRGRNYEAFFAKDIPITDGPMKFNGLPGLILKVKLIDGQAIFETVATKVEINTANVVIKNPYTSSMPFTEYKEKYIKKITELQSYYAGSGTTIGTNGLEILIFDE
ncbi:MAG: GLPGLI family protein [Flavobacterium sp.]|jgi:GLPGLI family protein